MTFTACECRAAYYQQVKRSTWMKMMPGRRLFLCHACDKKMLLDPDDVRLRMRKERKHDPRLAQGGKVAFRGS